MSECVVRMGMPKACWSCDLRFVCKAAYDFLTTKETGCSVLKVGMPGCLILCQLPEGHGRLVDADAFFGHMKEYQEKIMEWRERSKTEGPEESYHRADSSLLTVVATKLILDNAPTIVPAERSET